MVELMRTKISSFGILTLLISFSSAGRVLFDIEDCEACKMTTKSILEDYGYPAEEHKIQTKDGYLLSLFRIPFGKNNTRKSIDRIPFLAQHGGNGLSDNWVVTLDNSNDTYVTRLAENNYDVWLTNVRGSRYARHIKYNITQTEYWDFSVDDIALIDLKAHVDFVLEATGYPSIAYGGHSLGGLYITMLLSEYPEYSDKIHYAQLLSPVVFLQRNPSLSIQTSMGRKTMSPFLAKSFEFVADHKLLASVHTVSTKTAKRVTDICWHTILFKPCTKAIGSTIGFDPLSFHDLTRDRMEMLLEELSQGLGVKQVAHLMQLASKDDVVKYNYRGRNIQVYGTKSPPKYNISNIRTTIKIYYPKNDKLLAIPDAEKFFRKLKNANVSKHLMKYEHFNHFDYFYGIARFRFMDLALRDINEFHDSRKFPAPA